VNFVRTENLGWSRNSGPVVFHSYRKSGAFQKFWTSRIQFIQKFLNSGPGVFYSGKAVFIHTEHLDWSRNTGPGVFHITENLDLSRNSEAGVFHSNRISGLVQKFWSKCISFIQKIWAGPEILDQLYFIHKEDLDWSRNSKPGVFLSYRKSGLVQKF
jgi:hypothetical protein